MRIKIAEWLYFNIFAPIGNWLAYETRLIKEHGQEYVDALKRENEATKGLMYREEWYQARIAEYQSL